MNRKKMAKTTLSMPFIALVFSALAMTNACEKSGSLPISIVGDRLTKDLRGQSSESDTSREASKNTELQQISSVDSPLVDQFLDLVTDISARAPGLNRERDRRGKLRQELSADLGAGCMQDVKVRNLEVILSGQRLGDLDVSKHYRNGEKPPTDSEQASFEISFGNVTFSDSLSFNYDENQNTLFTANGRKSWGVDRQDFTIGKIQRIKIKKLSSNFKVQKICSGGTAITACGKEVSTTEVDRFHLDSLQIKVNGELIYARSDIGHTFASHVPGDLTLEPAKTHSLGWSEDNMLINEAYVQMQQKDDCTAVQ